MIDLMEIGRRLWEDGEPNAVEQHATDLMALSSEVWEEPAGDSPPPQESAAIRNVSAAAEPYPAQISANPQNPQAALPAPAHEAETIVTALVMGAGHDLGLPLVNRLRDVLAPMDRPARASMAAAIDDAFKAAQSAEEARQQVVKLLDSHTPRQAKPERLAGRPDWITWIAGQCPLLPEDRAFIQRRLHTLPPRAAERAARRYVETWQAAAVAEPKPQAKDNRGRTAANRTLLALVRR
ncbi:hypothetical protein [Franzmannia qiaohouensis]|uniref:DUF222 domain-containing protein n=1 Tax=Franzmannia qiaohouensis TaxID=1329370 RepID=A0ABU1H974_9GAMM|nr:hypothetical protein [Halomonas qiaohouensis]MDR5904003.1 hypothetical protein [Halomonas qiaohouensis]